MCRPEILRLARPSELSTSQYLQPLPQHPLHASVPSSTSPLISYQQNRPLLMTNIWSSCNVSWFGITQPNSVLMTILALALSIKHRLSGNVQASTDRCHCVRHHSNLVVLLHKQSTLPWACSLQCLGRGRTCFARIDHVF